MSPERIVRIQYLLNKETGAHFELVNEGDHLHIRYARMGYWGNSLNKAHPIFALLEREFELPTKVTLDGFRIDFPYSEAKAMEGQLKYDAFGKNCSAYLFNYTQNLPITPLTLQKQLMAKFKEVMKVWASSYQINMRDVGMIRSSWNRNGGTCYFTVDLRQRKKVLQLAKDKGLANADVAYWHNRSVDVCGSKVADLINFLDSEKVDITFHREQMKRMEEFGEDPNGHEY